VSFEGSSQGGMATLPGTVPASARFTGLPCLPHDEHHGYRHREHNDDADVWDGGPWRIHFTPAGPRRSARPCAWHC